jgi:hypothetical protein
MLSHCLQDNSRDERSGHPSQWRAHWKGQHGQCESRVLRCCLYYHNASTWVPTAVNMVCSADAADSIVNNGNLLHASL